MAIERIKGAIAFTCDLPGCDNSIETDEGDFRDASAVAKDAGWLFRNRDGDWKHYCSPGHEEMGYRGQSLVR